MEIENKIKLGRYKHYKGGEYRVVATVTHSETDEIMVLYQPLYLDRLGNKLGMWVRPIAMFKESVSTENGVVPRFNFIAE